MACAPLHRSLVKQQHQGAFVVTVSALLILARPVQPAMRTAGTAFVVMGSAPLQLESPVSLVLKTAQHSVHVVTASALLQLAKTVELALKTADAPIVETVNCG